MTTIDIIIYEDGQTNIEVNGINGKDCLDLTKDIELILGKPTERTLKSEFRNNPEVRKLYQWNLKKIPKYKTIILIKKI